MSKNSDKENPNLMVSRELSQKFEFYFLSLVFTILALSLQTASFTDFNLQCIMELSGWFFLAVSGVAGLSRLEWLPVAYRQYGTLQKEKNKLSVFIQGIKGGHIIDEKNEEYSIQELEKAKGKLESHITEREIVIGNLNLSTSIAYQIHKWGFVLGLFCIIFSRAFVAITKMTN